MIEQIDLLIRRIAAEESEKKKLKLRAAVSDQSPFSLQYAELDPLDGQAEPDE